MPLSMETFSVSKMSGHCNFVITEQMNDRVIPTPRIAAFRQIA